MVLSTIAGIAGAVGALGSSIYGAVASSKQNKKAQELLQQQRDDNRAWYNAKMSQDYTQRADAQAVINRQRELLDEQYKNATATNVVAGGSDASLAMQKAAANDAMAQTMSNIASEASDYKDQVEQAYRSQDAALNQQQAQNQAAQAQATAAAAGQAVNAGLNLVGQSLQTPVKDINAGKPSYDYSANPLAQAAKQQTLDAAHKALNENIEGDIRNKLGIG